MVTAERDTSIEDLARSMRDENVGSVVITDGAEPVGIVTDRDLSVRALAEAHGIEIAGRMLLEDLTAGDVMTYGPFTADVNDSVLEVLNDMCTEGCRRVPVVDGDELYGIVTLDDFIVLLTTELNDVASIVASESPPIEAGATADD